MCTLLFPHILCLASTVEAYYTCFTDYCLIVASCQASFYSIELLRNVDQTKSSFNGDHVFILSQACLAVTSMLMN